MKLSEMRQSDCSQSNAKVKTARQGGQKNNIMDTYESIKNCSGDELMNMLSAEIQSQKARGVFDYDGLCNTIERVRAYLPAETYQNMMRIIENLR